jgi:DNA-binding transcriptional MocR family regulator
MTIWAPDLTSRRGPTYLAIADALAADIQCGVLALGTRLPTHRELADTLHVTVGTITRAYGEAQRRNLISGEVGRGTFVGGMSRSDALFGRPLPLEPGLIDLSLNRAIQGLKGSDLAEALRSLAEAQDLDGLLDYQPDPGAPAHRAAAAAWLNGRGLTASPEHVVLTTGAQNAITAVLSCLTHPHDIVLTEALTYPGVKSAARLLHLRLEGLEMDEHGIVPAALERALRTTEARVLYTIPTLQNPTTRVMPLERRAALVEICRRYDATVIEDSVYSFLVEDAPPPLVRLAPERTYYLDSTSKLLGGGLRIGIVLAPPGQPVQQAAQRVAAQVRAASGIVTPLTAELARRWYEDGTAERLVVAQRAEARRRQDLAHRLLDPLPYAAHPHAPMIWLPLPEPWRMDDFVFQARNRGVAVTPGSVFTVGRAPAADAVRVCLGSIREERLTQGLAILGDLLRQPPEAAVSGA